MKVILSHGRGLNAQSKDMYYLGKTAENLGFEIHKINDELIQNPTIRKEKLSALIANENDELILAGFSMGAYTSLMVAGEYLQKIKGLFLIAPALYIPHYPQDNYPTVPNTMIIHGWKDSVVPVEHSIQYAEKHSAELIILNNAHTFLAQPELNILCGYFELFLKRFN